MIRGSTKTKVFPDPVNAIPIISLPCSLQKRTKKVIGLTSLDLAYTYTVGMPWICIGVGWVMPLAFIDCIIEWGNFISCNEKQLHKKVSFVTTRYICLVFHIPILIPQWVSTTSKPTPQLIVSSSIWRVCLLAQWESKQVNTRVQTKWIKQLLIEFPL